MGQHEWWGGFGAGRQKVTGQLHHVLDRASHTTGQVVIEVAIMQDSMMW
jgi:hypothetical protein